MLRLGGIDEVVVYDLVMSLSGWVDSEVLIACAIGSRNNARLGSRVTWKRQPDREGLAASYLFGTSAARIRLIPIQKPN